MQESQLFEAGGVGQGHEHEGSILQRTRSFCYGGRLQREMRALRLHYSPVVRHSGVVDACRNTAAVALVCRRFLGAPCTNPGTKGVAIRSHHQSASNSQRPYQNKTTASSRAELRSSLTQYAHLPPGSYRSILNPVLAGHSAGESRRVVYASTAKRGRRVEP